MRITAQISDYSEPAHREIKVHNAWSDGSKVELEVDDKRYTVSGKELISAIERCMLNSFGR